MTAEKVMKSVDRYADHLKRQLARHKVALDICNLAPTGNARLALDTETRLLFIRIRSWNHISLDLDISGLAYWTELNMKLMQTLKKNKGGNNE